MQNTQVTPSPQPRELFRITPTEHGFDVQIAEGVTLSEAAKLFIQAVERQLDRRPTFEWRSVEKEMPEREVWVLVCGTGWLWAGIGRWDGKAWQQDAGLVLNTMECPDIDWGAHNIEVAPFVGVTHWMPLPDVVKEEK